MSDNFMVVINKSPRHKVVRQLIEKQYCVFCTADLYDMPDDSVTASALGEYPGKLLICSEYTPRATKAILAARGVSRDFELLDTTNLDGDKLLAAIENAATPATGELAGMLRDFYQSTKPRWYPLIDPDRCTNCGNCLEFCLFGVYETDGAGKCFVAIADNCKTGCPSCSRVCPAAAIIFPHYPGGGAIAGGDGTIERKDYDQARQMGGGDVQLYKEKYGDADGDEQIASDLDDLESFDAG